MKDYTKNSRMDWTPETSITTITPSIIDKDKFLYVQEMGVMYGYPTFYTRRENLPSFELLYTEAGRACLEYNLGLGCLMMGRPDLAKEWVDLSLEETPTDEAKALSAKLKTILKSRE